MHALTVQLDGLAWIPVALHTPAETGTKWKSTAGGRQKLAVGRSCLHMVTSAQPVGLVVLLERREIVAVAAVVVKRLALVPRELQVVVFFVVELLPVARMPV